MISSISGLVLDSFNLTKPVGWKPDLAGRTAFLASFKQSYFPGGTYPGSGTYLETTGAQLQQHPVHGWAWASACRLNRSLHACGCRADARLPHLRCAGIPLTGALVIFAALQQTLADPAVIAQLAAAEASLRLSVNGPDTVVPLACAFLLTTLHVTKSPHAMPVQ